MSQSDSPETGKLSGSATTPEVETNGFLEAKATLDGILSEGVERTSIENMTEPVGKGSHGHGPVKGMGEGSHDVRRAFDVNPEIITEMFDAGTLPNGHEALAVLVANREALIEADTPLFLDAPDDSSEKWERIKNTRQNAPISPRREAEIYADAD